MCVHRGVGVEAERLTVTHMGTQPWKLGPQLAGALSRGRQGGVSVISGSPVSWYASRASAARLAPGEKLESPC